MLFQMMNSFTRLNYCFVQYNNKGDINICKSIFRRTFIFIDAGNDTVVG